VIANHTATSLTPAVSFRATTLHAIPAFQTGTAFGRSQARKRARNASASFSALAVQTAARRSARGNCGCLGTKVASGLPVSTTWKRPGVAGPRRLLQCNPTTLKLLTQRSVAELTATAARPQPRSQFATGIYRASRATDRISPKASPRPAALVHFQPQINVSITRRNTQWRSTATPTARSPLRLHCWQRLLGLFSPGPVPGWHCQRSAVGSPAVGSRGRRAGERACENCRMLHLIA
jgi:hypothetical protein